MKLVLERKIIDETREAMRVSKVSIVVNLILSAGKLAAGVVAHSGAMVSDAIHSASDVFSTFVVMIGINISAKKADEQHPYGHERLECVAAIILAVILLGTGVIIGFDGIDKIITGEYRNLKIPGMPALVAAVVSIAVKEWMYWFTIIVARTINSGALKADAWHHRSDAFSSVGALIGILGGRMGYPVLDCVASVIICIFIVKAAFDIFKDAIDKMVDKACDAETQEAMHRLIMSRNGVKGIRMLHTRVFGAKIYVDAEIEADGSLSLFQAHAIAEDVHEAIEKEFSSVKHCMVHVDPV